MNLKRMFPVACFVLAFGSSSAMSALNEGLDPNTIYVQEDRALASPVPGVPLDVESAVDTFFNIRDVEEDSGFGPTPVNFEWEWPADAEFQTEPEPCPVVFPGVSICR